jgi:Zn-dependent peptidase ImmA (M78 family)/transcriptional regulator with XRE-family HTH domain
MATRNEALASPDVIAWARRMAGLEVQEAARKVGTPPHRLESWERGERRPSITQLRKLADVYKRPLAVFFLDKPPTDDPTPSDFRRFDPQAAEPLSPALRLVIRDAHSRREAALELFDELDEEPPQFKPSARLTDDPEVVGNRLRAALVNGTPPATGDPRLVFNFWRTAAEGAGVLVFQAEDVDVDEMRGFSISERPLPAVVLNIKDAFAARSFSLFHELAHVMLNRGGLCIFEEQGPHTDFQQTEVFCNHVAGAALLPAADLLREPGMPAHRVSQVPDTAIAEVAKRYGASREAVLRRLVILDRVPVAFYQRKRQEYAREFERRSQAPRQGGFAPPYTMAVATSGKLFTRLVLQAYDDERITSSDVAEHLGVRLKHLNRIRAAVREEPAIGEPA